MAMGSRFLPVEVPVYVTVDMSRGHILPNRRTLNIPINRNMIIKIKPFLILFLEGEVRPRGEVRDNYSRKRGWLSCLETNGGSFIPY